jgi:hypothetical protein
MSLFVLKAAIHFRVGQHLWGGSQGGQRGADAVDPSDNFVCDGKNSSEGACR